MKRLFLLEGIPERPWVSPHDTVVALSAEAVQMLDTQGVPHQITWDEGVEETLQQQEPSLWTNDLSWLDGLDDALERHLPELRELRLRPALLFGYPWKVLLDNLYARGLEIHCLLRKGHAAVVFCPGSKQTVPPDRFESFCSNTHGIYAWWIKAFCEKEGLPLEWLPSQDRAMGSQPRTSRIGARTVFKQWLWRGKGILSRSRKGHRLTLLFLESDHYLKDLLADALRAGHRCLLATEERILDLSDRGRFLPTFSRASSKISDLPDRWARTAEELAAPNSPVWRWLRSWFDVCLSPLLSPVLKAWIGCRLPKVVEQTSALREFYNAQQIDFVLTPSIAYRLQFPAIAACSTSEKTQSIHIADGSGPVEAPAWDLTELFLTQHYVVPDEEFAAYFRDRARRADRPTARIHVGTDPWKRYARFTQRPGFLLQRWESRLTLKFNRPPLRLPDERPVVVYPLAKPEPDGYRLHRADYGQTWHYRLQKALLETFAQIPDYLFVIKLFPSQEVSQSPVARAVTQMGKRHLLLSRSPFRLWLPWANRVILDFPSTPLYETAVAGVPFHLLLYRRLKVRPSALCLFQSALSLFETPQEAVERVKSYLARRQPDPLPFHPVEDRPILSTLDSIRFSPPAV